MHLESNQFLKVRLFDEVSIEFQLETYFAGSIYTLKFIQDFKNIVDPRAAKIMLLESILIYLSRKTHDAIIRNTRNS